MVYHFKTRTHSILTQVSFISLGKPIDFYSIHYLKGDWNPIRFQSPPSARYGMASANALNGGLYIFGGFGLQSSSTPYNPYSAYASGQHDVNYNYATPPNFIQNPILLNNHDFVNNPNYNPMSGTSEQRRQDDDDGQVDDKYYPLNDAWFLNYMYGNHLTLIHRFDEY